MLLQFVSIGTLTLIALILGIVNSNTNDNYKPTYFCKHCETTCYKKNK